NRDITAEEILQLHTVNHVCHGTAEGSKGALALALPNCPAIACQLAVFVSLCGKLQHGSLALLAGVAVVIVIVAPLPCGIVRQTRFLSHLTGLGERAPVSARANEC